MESILCRVALLLVMFTGLLSTGQEICKKRNLNFNKRVHYEFTADGSEENFINALKGSNQILEGTTGNNINLNIRYDFHGENDLDQGGFKGKVCFEIKGSSVIYISWAGIGYCSQACSNPEEQCESSCSNPEEPCETSCVGGGLYRQMPIEIEEANRRSFNEHCVDATGNSQLSIGLTADVGQKVQVQKFFIRGCEVISEVEYVKT